MTALLRMTERPMAAEQNALSKRVAKELGYMQLANLEGVTRDECVLFDACVAAGVRPFQTASVEAYKEARANNLPRRRAGSAFLIAAIITVVAGFVLALALATPWPLLGCVVGFFLGFVGGPILLGGAPSRRWVSNGLDGFAGPVPAGVLDMALSVREQCPEARFVVHSLVEDKQTFDPFLSVRYGSAGLYIAVWDEPRFDARYE